MEDGSAFVTYFVGNDDPLVQSSDAFWLDGRQWTRKPCRYGYRYGYGYGSEWQRKSEDTG